VHCAHVDQEGRRRKSNRRSGSLEAPLQLPQGDLKRLDSNLVDRYAKNIDNMRDRRENSAAPVWNPCEQTLTESPLDPAGNSAHSFIR